MGGVSDRLSARVDTHREVTTDHRRDHRRLLDGHGPAESTFDPAVLGWGEADRMGHGCTA